MRRTVILTIHVTATVGWLGAVAAFLALALAGLVTRDPSSARGIYLAMEASGWFVIVPFSLASLATGLLQSLTTEWGLLRHYWIIATWIINIVAAGVLLLFMRGLDLAAVATPRPAVHAAAALALLLAATALSIFKPGGLTAGGLRRQARRLALTREASRPA